MNKVAGLVRRCVEDYDMISDGETIAVCVSGGKDSVALLCALKSLSFYYPKQYRAARRDACRWALRGWTFTPIRELCDRLEVPFTLQ